MARVFVYSRVSTSRQIAGLGMSRQTDGIGKIRKWCSDNGHTLADIDIMHDSGSAFSGANAQPTTVLGRFLIAAETGEVERGSYFMVDHLNRLTRQRIRAAIGLLFQLQDAGINVVTVHDWKIYSEKSDTVEMDLMQAIIFMMEAHKSSLEKQRIALINHEKKREAAKQGKVSTRMLPAWLQIKYAENEPRENAPRIDIKLTAQDEIVPNELAKIVKRIFTDVANGIGCYAVSRRLNNEKIPPLNGGKQRRDAAHNPLGPVSLLWSTGAVAKLIKNDAPLGWYQPHENRKPIGQPIKNYYPVIISQTLADRARAQILSHTKITLHEGNTIVRPSGAGRKGVHYSNLLTGIAKCAHCGGSAFLYNFNPKRGNHGWLRCTNAIRSDKDDKCANRTGIPYRVIEDMIVTNIHWHLAERQQIKDDPMKELREQIALNQAEIAKIEASSSIILEGFAKSPNQLVTNQINKMAQRQVLLTREIAILEQRMAVESLQPDMTAEDWQKTQLIEKMASHDPKERYTARSTVAGMLRSMIDRIECHDDKTIEVKFPPMGMPDGSGGADLTRILTKMVGSQTIWKMDSVTQTIVATTRILRWGEKITIVDLSKPSTGTISRPRWTPKAD
jgi:DNA invertase Pin-like site-specific DNA recombinase